MKLSAVAFILIGVLLVAIVFVGAQQRSLFMYSGGAGTDSIHSPFKSTVDGGRRKSPAEFSYRSVEDMIPPNARFPNGTSNNINWLGLLQAVQAGAVPNDKYKVQLAEAYVNYSQGVYDSVAGFASFPTPSTLFVAHLNETGNQMFLQDKVSDGTYKLVEIDESKVKAAGYRISGWGYGTHSGGVWANLGNKDDMPDGPLQVINAKGVDAKFRRKGSALDKYDTYNLIDQFNAFTARRVESQFTNLPDTLSADVRDMYATMMHNRGSWRQQSWGVRYDGGGAGKYLGTAAVSSESTSIPLIYNTFKEVINKYGAEISKDRERAMAAVILVANGWYIDDCRDGASTVLNGIEIAFGNSDCRKVIDGLFPNHGQSTGTGFKTFIKTNYVKKLSDVLNVSGEFVQRVHRGGINGDIIGTWPGTDGGSRVYWFIFKVTDKVCDETYFPQLKSGETTKQVYIWDTIALQYILGSVSSDAKFLKWLLIEGLLDTFSSSLTENGEDAKAAARRLFDPNNPVHIMQKRGDGFNPASAGPAGNDVIELLTLLGEDLTKISQETLKQLEVLMAERGSFYDQRYRVLRGTKARFEDKTPVAGLWMGTKGNADRDQLRIVKGF